MTRNEQDKTPPIVPHTEVFIHKEEYGDEVDNQWSFKIIKVDSVETPKIHRKTETFVPVEIEKALLLNNDGEAFIIFDVSLLTKYSICVINESNQSLSFRVELSPNNKHYIEMSPIMEVKPWQMECAFSSHYLKFVRVHFFGKSAVSLKVYLQGMK